MGSSTYSCASVCVDVYAVASHRLPPPSLLRPRVLKRFHPSPHLLSTPFSLSVELIRIGLMPSVSFLFFFPLLLLLLRQWKTTPSSSPPPPPRSHCSYTLYSLWASRVTPTLSHVSIAFSFSVCLSVSLSPTIPMRFSGLAPVCRSLGLSSGSAASDVRLPRPVRLCTAPPQTRATAHENAHRCTQGGGGRDTHAGACRHSFLPSSYVTFCRSAGRDVVGVGVCV